MICLVNHFTRCKLSRIILANLKPLGFVKYEVDNKLIVQGISLIDITNSVYYFYIHEEKYLINLVKFRQPNTLQNPQVYMSNTF